MKVRIRIRIWIRIQDSCEGVRIWIRIQDSCEGVRITIRIWIRVPWIYIFQSYHASIDPSH